MAKLSKLFKASVGALGELLSNQRAISDDGLVPEQIVKDLKIVNNETNIDKLLEMSSRDDVANLIINELNAEMPFDEVVEIAEVVEVVEVVVSFKFTAPANVNAPSSHIFPLSVPAV